jgi:hypothetical protein
VAQQATAPATTRYAERLRVPWWLWLPALAMAALLAAEVYLGAPGLRTWIPYAVLLPLTAIGLWRLGRLRIAVEEGELRVDDARLPVGFVAGVTVVGVAEKRVLLGTGARPHAFVVQRPWVGGAVQVHLDDPADPTPYWLVSARDPAALAAALLRARAGSGA